MIFFLTESGLYKNFGKVLDSQKFSNDPEKHIFDFLLKHLSFIKRKNISVWQLLLYSRLTQKVNSSVFTQIVNKNISFIKDHSINDSLSNKMKVLDFQKPILFHFLHWGDNTICIDLLREFSKDFNFSNEFCNEILYIIQGLEVSSGYYSETPGKPLWNFQICHDLFKELLGEKLELSLDNANFLHNISVLKYHNLSN